MVNKRGVGQCRSSLLSIAFLETTVDCDIEDKTDPGSSVIWNNFTYQI